MTSITGYEFIELFESHVPTWLAEDGDPVGLHSKRTFTLRIQFFQLRQASYS